METKLAPCPFCGGTKIECSHHADTHHFACGDCGTLVIFTGGEATPAVVCWNEASLRTAAIAAYQALLPHVEFSGEETETAVLKQVVHCKLNFVG